MAISALFRVFFGAIHICRMKAKMNARQYRIKHQNLSKMVDTMKGNLEDSAHLLKSYLENEQRDQADDDLMASHSPLDLKIKKELAIKAEKERTRRRKGPEVVAIMDADNDDVEFSDAEAEEIKDVEEHE